MVKTILISQFSLPYMSIGSWTTLYHNYLIAHSEIDSIVCPKSENLFSNIEYSFVKESFVDRLQHKLLRKKKLGFLSALKKVLNEDDKYLFQVVDNYGMVKPLHDFLVEMGIRKNCYIQFFYHGFAPYQQVDSSEKFYNLLDEIIVLTQSSYEDFRDKVLVLPNYFSVLNNGIDTSKFKRISEEEKKSLKTDLNCERKRIFLWCSQDRPKKGLHIILDAWSKIYSTDKNIILLVIGCEARENTEGVQFLGKIHNHDLPKYYQAADCYFFSTLCQEGFGMSLIEALHCGCYCVASKLGGVPEVLQFGRYGKLIKNPHFVKEWVEAINEYLNSDFLYPQLPKELYSTETWNREMNSIIHEAKLRLENKTLI